MEKRYELAWWEDVLYAPTDYYRNTPGQFILASSIPKALSVFSITPLQSRNIEKEREPRLAVGTIGSVTNYVC